MDFCTSTYGEITGNSSLVKPSPSHSKALLCLTIYWYFHPLFLLTSCKEKKILLDWTKKARPKNF